MYANVFYCSFYFKLTAKTVYTVMSLEFLDTFIKTIKASFYYGIYSYIFNIKF